MNIKYLLLFFLSVGSHANKDITEKGEKENKYLLIKLIDKMNKTNDGVDYGMPLSMSCNDNNDGVPCEG